MKTTTKILAAMLACLLLAACKSKERVTDICKDTATAHETASSSAVRKAAQSGTAAAQESNLRFQQSDSVVSRFYERIVADSTGRVMWHETEQQTDRFKGKTASRASHSDVRQQQTSDMEAGQVFILKDSARNAEITNDMTVVKKKSRTWLAWLFGSLLTAGLVLLKYRRK